MGSENRAAPKRSRWIVPAGMLAIVLMVVLRCVALDSDAYPRLSWSSALLTDEGFYIHNARNRVLFGHAETDRFNNNLIMPLLDVVQTGVFRLFGVGAIQARAISVVMGLLTLLVFYDALRRAFGRRTAWIGGLLLGLDHVSLLYSRLALMDTPAACVLVCAFWLWVRSGEGEGRSRLWLALCGMTLGVCYAVRGLGALVYPMPMLLLAREAWKERQATGKRGGLPWLPLASLLGGLILALGIYGILWYLPHRAELTRVNHYYLFDQLVPHQVRGFFRNWGTGLFGDQRGLMPFLFRHEPVQICLALFWLLRRCAARLRPKETLGEMRAAQNADFLALWLLVFWALLGSIDYAPSRYYVLFLPALSALAGLILSDVLFSEQILQNRAIAIICGLCAFYLSQSLLHHVGIWSMLWPGLIGAGSLCAVWFLQSRRGETPIPTWGGRLPSVALVVWLLVNLYWTGDWLLHLTYKQRDADRWLAENLPANSVLIGAVAPGLSMNSRFPCVSVIEKLCNDQQPVEKYAPAPRYILILDDRWREVWWQRHYPDLVAPARRVHTFPGLLRPFFTIGVYRVPDEIGRHQ